MNEGFKDFILGFDNLQNLYLENFIVVFVSILTGNFCFLISSWKKLIYRTNIDNTLLMKFLIYSSCTIMSFVIYFPQRLLINIASIIIYYIFFKRCGFNDLAYDLDTIYEDTFLYRIRYIF